MQFIKLGHDKSAPQVESPSIVTIGNFDGVHRGHQTLIKAMQHIQQSMPDAKTTLLTFDRHPITYFNPTCFEGVITGLREKSFWLQHYGVERLALTRFRKQFANLSAEEFIERQLITGVNAKALLIGRDFVFGKARKGNLGLLQQYADRGAFKVIAIEDVLEGEERISSTLIRSAIKQGQLSKARQYLGHPMNIMGRVVKGKQLGRTIGFPTANVKARSEGFIFNGVYAVRVQSSAGWRSDGVANIGLRPTVDIEGRKSIEVHLFDYNQDCYGECLTVDLVSFIRPEQKFADLTALQEQIKHDVSAAKLALADR